MKKNKARRAKLSFSLAALGAQIHLGAVGINLPNIKQSFEGFEKADVSSYGSVWGSMNDPKYYAGITAENVVPKPEDFISVPFRLLSAAIVGGGSWKAADFSKANVLKKSAPKLQNKPVYKDHETDLDNWVGIVGETKWTAERMQGDVKIPAGIDGVVLIDAKTNPKIARGVLMGSIFSNSVTVDFEWEPSHEFENELEFYDQIGRYHADGTMVRRVATKIHDFYETSLVWLGADPYAKSLDADGNLVNVDASNIYDYARASFSKSRKKSNDTPEGEVDKAIKNLHIDFALDENVLSLRQNIEERKNTDIMNKFWLAFFAVYGTALNLKAEDKDAVDSFSDERITELLSRLQLKDASLTTKASLADDITAQIQEHARLMDPNATVDVLDFLKSHTFIKPADLVAKDATITSLQADADLGKQYAKTRKEEAVRLYKASVDSPDVNVIALFNKAGNEAIDGLLAQYTKKATEKFGGKCNSCGGHDFSFQSSMVDNPEEVTPESAVSYSAEDFRKEFGQVPLFNQQ